jgi:hypothetical protein
MQTEQTGTEDHRDPMVVRVSVDVEDEEQNSERKDTKTWQRPVKSNKTADLQHFLLARIEDDDPSATNGDSCVDISSLFQ